MFAGKGGMAIRVGKGTIKDDEGAITADQDFQCHIIL